MRGVSNTDNIGEQLPSAKYINPITLTCRNHWPRSAKYRTGESLVVATVYTPAAYVQACFISDGQTHGRRPISLDEHRRQSPRRTVAGECSAATDRRLHECCKIWRTLSSSAFYMCARVCAACRVCWTGAKEHWSPADLTH